MALDRYGMLYFSLFDSKAEKYLPPFPAPTEAAAVRSLTNAIMDVNSEFHRFAEDYTLYEVGAFDDDTGSMAGLSHPRQVCLVLTIKQALKAGNGA